MVLSKFQPISVSCKDYVHPWTNSCMEATAGLYLYAIKDCLRIYGTVYILALFMKGRIPNLEDLKRTLAGIIQSTAFLSGTAFGYSAFLCSLRRLFGNYNIVTVSFLPVFLSSVFAIMIERPSRRVLLALYVSNVATETVWNMLRDRNLVKNVPYAPTLIFASSIAFLLMYFKGGQHRKNQNSKPDSIYSALRFVVGPYEESNYVQRRSEEANSQIGGPSNLGAIPRRPQNRNNCKYPILRMVNMALRVYRKMIQKIKCMGRNQICPHPFSCAFYGLQGTTKMFGVGLGIQCVLKLLFNIQRIIKKPSSIKTVFKKDVFSLAIFLGGFTGSFRVLSCILRYFRGKDSPSNALISGFLAGAFFSQYSDTTIALYVFWKLLQLTYNIGVENKKAKKVPYFTEFLYCFSTGLLFHAAIVEPMTLRPSYWKFLHNISGGRVACMDRSALDTWGLSTSDQLYQVLDKTRTVRELSRIFSI